MFWSYLDKGRDEAKLYELTFRQPSRNQLSDASGTASLLSPRIGERDGGSISNHDSALSSVRQQAPQTQRDTEVFCVSKS